MLRRTSRQFHSLRKLMHPLMMKVHPDLYKSNKNESIFGINEKCLMELNSFIDVASLHCEENNVKEVPNKQLPKPSQVYNIQFYMKDNNDIVHMEDNVVLIKHKIFLPDPLFKTDITTLTLENERNNLVCRWQKFALFTLNEILNKANIKLENEQILKPTLEIINVITEKNNKIKNDINSSNREKQSSSGKEKKRKETISEACDRLHIEDIYSSTKFDMYDIDKQASILPNDTFEEMENFVRKIQRVERLFHRKQVLLKGLDEYQKKEGIINFKRMLVNHYDELCLNANEWQNVIIVLCDRYGLNETDGMLAIPYDAEFEDLDSFIAVNLPLIKGPQSNTSDNKKKQHDNQHNKKNNETIKEIGFL